MDNDDSVRRCRNGHPHIPENRMAIKSGSTRCRLCWNEKRRSKNPEHQARYAARKTPADPTEVKARKRAQEKARRDRNKLLVLAAYGNKCSCCAESLPLLLTVDHVNNDGAAHRKEMGNSTRVYDWLIRNDFPEGYQVLCWNCNVGKHLNGGTYCPHQTTDVLKG